MSTEKPINFKAILEDGFNLLRAAKLKEVVAQVQQPPSPASTMPSAVPSPAPATNQPPAQQQEITVDMVIEKLNVIRSGKSFKDAEVYGKLTTLFKTMPEQEKASLNAALVKIEEIIKSTLPQGNVQAAPLAPALPQQAAPPAPQPAAGTE